jgi:hypothetical protein
MDYDSNFDNLEFMLLRCRYYFIHSVALNRVIQPEVINPSSIHIV